MPQHDNIDAESLAPVAALYEALPGGFNAIPDIHARRETLNGMLKAMTADLPPNENVVVEDRTVPGPEGAPEIGVRIYRPANATGVLPGILFIHGGGMVLGNLDSDHLTAVMLCETIGAVMVSVDYRLAPENPAPAAIEDCYAGLQWMAANADELGFDLARLALFGLSAGGGLAIATALVARDRSGPALCFMMPIYPQIDDRNETASSREIVDIGIWDRAGNIEAWEWYLGGQPADQYSAPGTGHRPRRPAARLHRRRRPRHVHGRGRRVREPAAGRRRPRRAARLPRRVPRLRGLRADRRAQPAHLGGPHRRPAGRPGLARLHSR